MVLSQKLGTTSADHLIALCVERCTLHELLHLGAARE